MKKILITGCGGLVGLESTYFFLDKGFEVLGIDNNMRSYFFGDDGSVKNNLNTLSNFKNFKLYKIDIRNYEDLEKIFNEYSSDIDCIIHAAAQPSHDWAAKEPFTDFHINTTATINLLELTKKYCDKATFIFTSTNKVYGDNPNHLPLIELETRYELEKSSRIWKVL
jgi:CDP-paratose 2-epimerase